MDIHASARGIASLIPVVTPTNSLRATRGRVDAVNIGSVRHVAMGTTPELPAGVTQTLTVNLAAAVVGVTCTDIGTATGGVL